MMDVVDRKEKAGRLPEKDYLVRGEPHLIEGMITPASEADAYFDRRLGLDGGKEAGRHGGTHA